MNWFRHVQGYLDRPVVLLKVVLGGNNISLPGVMGGPFAYR
jgi:hypothetical protein